MRARMDKTNRKRDLGIAVLLHSDTGGGTAKRAPSVGADHERRLQRLAAPERHGNRALARHDAQHLVVDQAQV